MRRRLLSIGMRPRHLFVCFLRQRNRAKCPIHVVVTMRSDFIGDCARFHGLPEAVSRKPVSGARHDA